MAPLPGVLMPGLMPGLMQGAMGGAFAGASRIVVLKNAVEVDELNNTTDYEEIVQDMQVRLRDNTSGGVLLLLLLLLW
jgi:hypothetical protein